MTIREARWDCQFCGGKAILGRHKSCPTCNQSRPAGTTFYLVDDETTSDEKVLAQARVGPDWICAYCSSSNRADAAQCHHCLAPRLESTESQAVKEYGLGAAPTTGDMTVPEAAAAPAATAASARPRGRRRSVTLGLVGLALLLLCSCATAIFFLTRTDNVSVTVASLEWERSIEVERLTTVVEEDWSLPAGARLLEQNEAIRSYNRVQVGTERRQREVAEQIQTGQRTYVCGQRDLGNGFFEDIECQEPVYETRFRTEFYDEPVYEEVPVYATRYRYEIDRWVTDRTARVEGRDGAPFWPEVPDAGPTIRAGSRSERYVVVFVDDEGQNYSLEFDEAAWRRFAVGERHTLAVNSFGEARELVE